MKGALAPRRGCILRLHIKGAGGIKFRGGVITQDGTQSFGEVFTDGSYIFPSNPYEGIGSWLVKPAVIPIPPSAVLFLSGMFVVYVFRVKSA